MQIPRLRARRPPAAATFLLSLVSGGWGAAPSSASAQAPVQVVRGEPTCAECTIERYLVATIHDTTFAEGALISGGAVHVNQDGTFFVLAGPGGWHELFLAGRDGAITRRVGKRGEGPGEYENPFNIVETPRHYLILDSKLGRGTYLSKDDLTVERTIRVPVGAIATAPLALPDGSFAIYGELRAEGAQSRPLHIVSADGEILASFGTPGVVRSRVGLQPRALTTSRDGGIWVAYNGGYRVEKWDRDENLASVLERRPDWFRSRNDATESGQEYTEISGVREDDQGRLWVHLATGTMIERETLVDDGRERRLVTRLVPDRDPQRSGSIVEILDPAGGTLRASSRLRGWRPIGGGSGLYQQVIRTSTVGYILIDVYSFRLGS